MSTRKSIILSAAFWRPFCGSRHSQVGTGMAADSEKMERTVSVSATGKVTAEADVAQISAGVVTEADSAKDAMGRNSVVMTKLIEGLKAAGIRRESRPRR